MSLPALAREQNDPENAFGTALIASSIFHDSKLMVFNYGPATTGIGVFGSRKIITDSDKLHRNLRPITSDYDKIHQSILAHQCSLELYQFSTGVRF